MVRRRFLQAFVTALVTLCVPVFSGLLQAQGNSDAAFERVKEVQERHTNALMARPGVVGTAVGLNPGGQHVVLVLLENDGVAGVPAELDGVPVRRVVTGKIYALAPGGKPGKPGGGTGTPKAPRALTATAVSQGQIDLDWKDNRESGVTYYVYRSGTSGSYDFTDALATPSSSAYSDTTVAAGTTYYYVVTAGFAADSQSGPSNEASATTPSAPGSPPDAPSNLTATATGSTQIDLAWVDNAANEDGFRIERSEGGGFSQIATVGANVTVYSNTGLAADTTYTYRVYAYNGSGASGYSNPASATTEPAGTEPPIGPRPAPIGVSTGHPNITAGTIGCRVTKGGNVYALSNNHVYADENAASIGDNVLQPGPYDGGQDPRDAIGTLAEFEPIQFDGSDNTIDAAIALSSTANLGNSTPAGGYGTPSSSAVAPALLMYVKKYGRTTGETTGAIVGVNSTVNVGYGSGTARFVGQFLVYPGDTFSAGGDSGSLIVTQDGNHPVGLLFAGSIFYTVANPIQSVLNHFGVTVDGN